MSEVGKKALKAGAWYTICSFIMKTMSFLTMPLFARLLDPVDIGTYANLTSWVSILGSVVTLDLFSSVQLAYFEYQEHLDQYISTICIAGTFVTGVFYIVAVIFTDEITKLLGFPDYALHVMFLFFLVNPAILILQARFRIQLQYKQTIITSLLPSFLSVLVALVGTLIYENKLQARIYGYYGVWILFSLIMYLFVLFKGKRFEIHYLKFAFSISLPLVLHTLSNAILSSSDRVMITRICGPEYTAFYSMAYNIAIIVTMLWQAINQAWVPWVYDMIRQHQEKNINRVAQPILILFSIATVLILLLAPEILFILGGNTYRAAVYVVPPVMLGCIAQILYTLYVSIESYCKKQKQIMMGTAFAACVNIILNLILIPIFGYVAAAYTTLIAYVVLLFVHYGFVSRIGYQYIYDMRFNCSVLVILTFVGIVMNMLYGFTTLRLSIFGLLLLVMMIFLIIVRKELMENIREKNIEGVFQALKLMKKENAK